MEGVLHKAPNFQSLGWNRSPERSWSFSQQSTGKKLSFHTARKVRPTRGQAVEIRGTAGFWPLETVTERRQAVIPKELGLCSDKTDFRSKYVMGKHIGSGAYGKGDVLTLHLADSVHVFRELRGGRPTSGGLSFLVALRY
jgi:hypothetical protein